MQDIPEPAQPAGGGARATELDEMDDGRAAASLTYEFPGWKIYRAADRLCYASNADWQVMVRGEDWVALRDEIIRAVRRRGAP